MSIEETMTRYGYGCDFNSCDLIDVLQTAHHNGDEDAIRSVLGFTGGSIPLIQHLYHRRPENGNTKIFEYCYGEKRPFC